MPLVSRSLRSLSRSLRSLKRGPRPSAHAPDCVVARLTSCISEGVRTDEVTFFSDGVRLHGFLHRPDQASGRRPFVVGWDDLALELAEAALEGTRAWVEHMPSRPIEYEILSLDPMVAEGVEAVEMAMGAALVT